MKKQYWIPSARYPQDHFRRVAQEPDMAIILERMGHRWPDEGMPPREVRGVEQCMETKEKNGARITVWVTPAQGTSPARRKSSKHRVLCNCPGCGRTMGVGRLAQHVCRGPK